MEVRTAFAAWIARLGHAKDRLGAAFADLERRSSAFAVLVSAARSFDEDHCTHLAAGIAYYAVFSLFPLLLGLIAIASFFVQSAEAQSRVVDAVSQILPGSTEVVGRNIQLVLVERSTIGVVAALTLLWSAKEVFGAITTSLNLAWKVPERRAFWKLTALQMGLVFGAGFFFALSLAVTSALALVSSLSLPVIGLRIEDVPLWALATVPISLALSIIAVLLLYRFLPCTTLGFGDVWPGALVAGIVFEIAKTLYVFYLGQFANYQLVYGSLAAFIALLFWAWISGAILLFGAEISAEYTRLRRRSPS